MIHKLWPILVNRLRDMRIQLFMTNTYVAPSQGRISLLSLEEESYLKGPTVVGHGQNSFSGELTLLHESKNRASVTNWQHITSEGPDMTSRLQISRQALHSIPDLMVTND